MDWTNEPTEFNREEQKALELVRDSLWNTEERKGFLNSYEKANLKLIDWALANMNLGYLPMWGSGVTHHSPEDYD